MFLQAGRLDQSIRIEQPSSSTDDYGEPIESWSTLATCFANVNPVSTRGANREALEGDQITATSLYEFNVRYSNAVNPTTVNETMRVIWRGVKFYIRSIQEKMRDQGLVIIAEKKDSWVSQS